MKRFEWLESDGDLLQQRRLARGLSAQAESVLPARRLLLQGGAVGVALLVVAVGFWSVLTWRQLQLRRQLEGLRGIPAQVNSLEAQSLGLRRRLSSLQRSNEGLAKGIVAVSSGSALLAQLATITPQGVQITDLQVQGSTLKLKGAAADPQAFRRVNALALLLAESPLFEAKEVKVVKLSRDSAKPGAPVIWDLTAAFASLPPNRQVQLLRDLGADGLARRLQILERAGVWP